MPFCIAEDDQTYDEPLANFEWNSGDVSQWNLLHAAAFQKGSRELYKFKNEGECDNWIKKQTSTFGKCGIMGGSRDDNKKDFNCEDIFSDPAPCLGYVDYDGGKQLTKDNVQKSFNPRLKKRVINKGNDETAMFYELTLKGKGYSNVADGEKSESCKMEVAVALKVCNGCKCKGGLIK